MVGLSVWLFLLFPVTVAATAEALILGPLASVSVAQLWLSRLFAIRGGMLLCHGKEHLFKCIIPPPILQSNNQRCVFVFSEDEDIYIISAIFKTLGRAGGRRKRGRGHFLHPAR